MIMLHLFFIFIEKPEKYLMLNKPLTKNMKKSHYIIYHHINS